MLDYFKKIIEGLREPLDGPLPHFKPGGIPRD